MIKAAPPRVSPRIIRRSVISAVLMGALISASCSRVAENLHGQGKYDNDYVYFAACRALEGGNETEALRLFREGTKKTSPLVRRRCAEELTRRGSAPERLEAASALIAVWKDDAALLRACEEFFAAREYRRVIDLTATLAPESPPELRRLRLSSLSEKKDSRVRREFALWAASLPFTESLYRYAEDYGVPEGLGQDEAGLFSARRALYVRNYEEAFTGFKALTETSGGPEFFLDLPDAAFSDLGKAFLYGGYEAVQNAIVLDNAAVALGKAGKGAFYPLFYSARLYDRSGGKTEWLALDRFQKAMEEALAAGDGGLYDNALWYYLSSALKISVAEGVKALRQFGPTFRDRGYFADFFDTFALKLLAAKQWDDFVALALIAGDMADKQTQSKFNYLAGRLITLNLAKEREVSAGDFYRRACERGGQLYYMLLGAHGLGLSPAETGGVIFPPPSRSGAGVLRTDEERLLMGYAEHGFPERIYAEWLPLRKGVAAEVSLDLAEFLQNCGNPLQTQGLRMAVRVLGDENALISDRRRALGLVFPRFFEQEITQAAEEFGLPPSYLFALTRSESFFDPEVSSHAGARGLTQLMDPTAADVARKLRVTDWDIFDPMTNLRFGAYYLVELFGRVNGDA
ncbi:MAG: transglycosylase SLT domain-containing protein, partial [Spirochaetaceae bacterium]|nr:transglycosylase SLT domain-containing protein [Spirochaetaceae bacterium]